MRVCLLCVWNWICTLIISSAVKYLIKNTLKSYPKKQLKYLYFTIYIWQLLLHYIPKENNVLFTPYISPDITFRMLSRTGILSNSHTYQENIPGHPYCFWSGGLTKHTCFICKGCLSVGVCPWLSVNSKNKKMVPFGLLNIRNLKLFVLLLFLLILKYMLPISCTFDT